MLSWRESMIYPQQLLRNVARQGCPTEFITLVDVDMIPMPNLAEELKTFLLTDEIGAGASRNSSCPECAYVIPVYEIAEEAKVLPRDKNELLKLVAANRARPFHKVGYIAMTRTMIIYEVLLGSRYKTG
jgi:N-acetyllactosaminide beta-1,3-N-acetylglucosaminyltransferase